MAKFENDVSTYEQQWNSYLLYLLATSQWLLFALAKAFRDDQMTSLTGVADTIAQFCTTTSARIDGIKKSGNWGDVPSLMSDVKTFCDANASTIEDLKTQLDSVREGFSGGVSDIQSEISALQSQLDVLEQQYDDAVAQFGADSLQAREIAIQMAPISLGIANLRFIAETIDGLEQTIVAMALELRSEYDDLNNMSQDIGDGLAILDDISSFIEELEN